MRARCSRIRANDRPPSERSARPRPASIRSPSTCSRRLVPRSRRSRPMSNGKMPDLNALMKQAQKLQGDVQRAQEELAKMTCDGAAGGGQVTAVVNGQLEAVRGELPQCVVDPQHADMVQ